ncbi:MAG TPA: NUDIX domain-containing protein [Candidatus Woesearchaeota archaeon]|nr:MAG: diadenosine tetraphosphate hydrolase [Candidatus Woesearchaeota archaeon]HDD70616.1 NUDIX domain-containing protein [Candidatus Woesearchaeota archaeon]
MKKEESAGIIIYKENKINKKKQRKYLLLHYGAGHWGFSKGHIEKGETSMEAAQRELEEETGIKKFQTEKGFKEEMTYFFRKNNELIHKNVTFYLAKVSHAKIRLSYEHKGYKWQTYEEALQTLTFKDSKELLKKAEVFLNEKS